MYCAFLYLHQINWKCSNSLRCADFELLAAKQLKKTIQTVAMRYGIDIEEDTIAAHADNGECNVYPAGTVIKPPCPHLVSSPDQRTYNP
ncbi:hypothetical protein pdam_00024516, partial [Pocillopora damicornis]